MDDGLILSPDAFMSLSRNEKDKTIYKNLIEIKTNQELILNKQRAINWRQIGIGAWLASISAALGWLFLDIWQRK